MSQSLPTLSPSERVSLVKVRFSSLLTQSQPPASPTTLQKASEDDEIGPPTHPSIPHKTKPSTPTPHKHTQVIRNVTNAVEALVAGWTVGLGLEAQLNALRESVGLPRLPALDAFSAFLDYRRLVRPEVVAATYEDEAYAHSEDFFFRSVHLGTDCWAFVVHNRLEGAREVGEQGRGEEGIPSVLPATLRGSSLC